MNDVLTELKADSALYRGIFEPEFLDIWSKPNLDVKESLYCITNVLNIAVANPLLLAILRLYRARSLKDGQVRELFSIVEKYHFMHTTICARPSSGGVGQMYAAQAREFSNAKDSNALGACIQAFKKKIKERVPKIEIFLSQFKQLSYSNPRQREVLRYTLWRITKAMNPALDLERATGTIEHVASQSKAGKFVHQIGNLLLVPSKFNGNVLGSKSFSMKKQLLKGGGYPLEFEMDAVDDWNDLEITARTDGLAEYAYETVWAIK